MLANTICSPGKHLHVTLADLKIYLTTNFVVTRRVTAVFFVIVAATSISMPVLGQSPDDSLRIYAVNVVKTTPFEEPFTGDGIYLGKGTVITAAHVIGRWAFLKNPHVLIAGQSFPAKIIKEGSAEQIDLTLLSVDEARLPVSFRLRRNPLCKQSPRVGQNVIVVDPDNIAHTQVISPQLIAPQFRMRFNTLIGDVAGGSGSGVFDAEKRCLMGIISGKVQKYERKDGGRIVEVPVGFAGYFVPASQIADFIPLEFRF
jgi:hypothetical protein